MTDLSAKLDVRGEEGRGTGGLSFPPRCFQLNHG